MACGLKRSWLIVAATILVLGMTTAAMAAITPEQRREAAAIRQQVDKAAQLYSKQQFKEAGEAVADAQARIDKFCETADAQAIKLLDTTMNRLTRAHALLELEGVALPPLKKPVPGGDKGMPDAPAEGGTSFVKDVAPILVTRCGNCHVRQARGRFSMSDYATLMKGPAEGVVIFPGNADGSRIVEVIVEGDMPRGGGKVPDAELALLKKWINEGAKFDGKEPATGLALLTDAKAEAPMAPEVKQATGKETISFARDVAPHLSDTCFNCHGAGQNLRANFNLTSFEGLLRGGDSGPPITPGKGADSLLVKKLKGTGGGNRMPQNLPPLPDDVIAKIEKWIDEGATYDGGDPKTNLRQVAQLAKALNSTHEELAAERVKLAEAKWRLSMPNDEANRLETDNFLILGNVGDNTVKQIGESAETVLPKVATILKATSNQPLIKGRMTLFAFDKRYFYAEFGNMVERRELPISLRGHFAANPVDVYAAYVHPRSEEYASEVMIAQQIAGGYVANLGQNTPRWFAEGTARAVAAKIGPEDPRVAAWDAALPEVLSGMSSPDDFLTGKLAPENADICNYSFVRFLMKDGRRFDALLNGLRKGQDFNQAFSAAYGGAPAQATLAWARSGPAKRR